MFFDRFIRPLDDLLVGRELLDLPHEGSILDKEVEVLITLRVDILFVERGLLFVLVEARSW